MEWIDKTINHLKGESLDDHWVTMTVVYNKIKYMTIDQFMLNNGS